MADNPLTLEKMLRGSQNLDVWDVATNGDENTDWTNLVGDNGPSLKKAIKTIMQKAPINSTPFATKAALLADTTLADGAFAFVYDDILENNGIYYKIGGKWSKGKYDTLRENFVKSVLNMTTSANIADLSKVENGKYVAYTDGLRYPNASYSVLGMYEVEPSTEYKVPQGTQQFAFYDINKNYISGKAKPDEGQIFTTPSNAYFVAFSVLTSIVNSFMLAKSSEYPSVFTPYFTNVKGLKINTNQISDLISTVKNELGFYTINIVDTSKIKANTYVAFNDGVEYANSVFSVGGFYEIKPNTEYQVSDWYNQQFAFYDANNVFLSGVAAVDSTHKFVTPSNARYAKFTIPNDNINALVVAESALFPSSYIAYGQSIKDLVTVTNRMTEIYVSADLNDNDSLVKFKGKNAIQQAIDSITDASATNRYNIVVKAGLYKITQANEFIGYPGYPAMVCPKDYVDIMGQGEGNTIVWAELPYDDAQISASINGQQYDRFRYQTIYNFSNSNVKDITFVAVNLRYTLHQDNESGANKSRTYKNVGVIFKGDKGGLKPYGIGNFSGEETYVDGGKSVSDIWTPFSVHNNVAFDKPSLWDFKGHEFTCIQSHIAIQLQNDGSLVQDKFNMIGCTFGGMAYVIDYIDNWLDGDTSKNHDSFNHAEWQITGYGNSPFLFVNGAKGQSLHFKTTGTGIDKSIRFDKLSSAYPLLIKNNHLNNDVALHSDSRDYVDGYIVQDGSVGLSAQAWGCLDVTETAYAYNSTTVYTSMAKRLGNLSASPKSLIVMINGVSNTITFNKDYSAMTNAQIVAEINGQLTGATVDLVSYGADYYPMMPDVTETVYNNGTTYIAKGSVVTKVGGFVKLANANDKVFGVALDDIPVMQIDSMGMRKGSGRVLKRGYILTDKARAHFVLADNQSPSIGTRFAVSNGQLVTDSNGKISVDIDAGVVSINC